MKENQQLITACGVGDVAPHVFLCGDPDRVPKIAASWTDVREVCRTREYVIQTGMRDGVALTAASTGVGGPSTAVIVEELVNLGAHTLIRVGNSGGLGADVNRGDYVITTASVRDDGTSKSYVCPEYPAAAHYAVTGALVDAAKDSSTKVHVGITWSLDAFYARNKVLGPDGLLPMSHGGYQQSWMNGKVTDMQAAKVLNVEMESSTILTLANLFGVRAGCICTVSDKTPWPGPGEEIIDLDQNIAGAIEIANRAMVALATNVSLA
ncbi:MAG: uridine phosphorylase [Verrucomicrobiales bacterium]|jgi:uridine phosphorylase